MTIMTNLHARTFDRQALEVYADWLAVAVAVSLPWSTTATGILVVVWLLAVVPTLSVAAVRRELATAVGGLPVLLWALAVVGMLWAHVSWGARLSGLLPYHRFLLIPLLLAQFRRSEHGMRVMVGFLLSVCGVLLFSWTLALVPAFPWHAADAGVPVKDYILQSDEFLMCAFVLFEVAIEGGRIGRVRSALALVALGVAFLANILFVVTARTTFLVAPVLALLLGWRHLRWRGVLAGGALFCAISGLAVVESPYLHARFSTSITQFGAWRSSDAPNSTGLHLQFLEESLSFIKAAPVVGHGTGSVAALFRREAAGRTGAAGDATANPHNQIFAVAIDLGALGAAVLLAMWAAHLMLFRGPGLMAWIGLIVVTENVVSSLVNSHLFDFTQAWLYVFGVGVAGGTMLRKRDAEAAKSHAASREVVSTPS